jgi:hypothetical protein
VSIKRETVEPDATGPNTAGSNRWHRDVGEAVPAERDGQREVQEDLARIMDDPRFAPRSERCG